MTLHEISELPLGTIVYRIRRGQIEQFETLSFSSTFPESYFFLIRKSDYQTAVGFYMSTNYDLHGHWEVDYEKAKEVMWEQVKSNVETINETYFNNKKEISWKD